jgi:hypothetical protein
MRAAMLQTPSRYVTETVDVSDHMRTVALSYSGVDGGLSAWPVLDTAARRNAVAYARLEELVDDVESFSLRSELNLDQAAKVKLLNRFARWLGAKPSSPRYVRRFDTKFTVSRITRKLLKELYDIWMENDDSLTVTFKIRNESATWTFENTRATSRHTIDFPARFGTVEYRAQLDALLFSRLDEILSVGS